MSTKLFAFNNTWSPGKPEHDWNVGYVIDENGKCVGNHCSSTNEWLKHDLGPRREDDYKKLYPDGYTIIWIPNAMAGGPEFDLALQRNAEFAASAKAAEELKKSTLPPPFISSPDTNASNENL